MGYSHDYKRTTWGRAVTLINNARTRSQKRNVVLEIGPEWVEKQLLIGHCQITKIPFSLEPPPEGTTRRWNAPSLDRIDKSLPYSETNTRVVLWAVNCALSEYGTETMLPILKAMIKGIEDAKPQSASPVSTGHYSKSEEHTKHGTVLATGSGEDDYYPHHHCGTVHREDLDHCTKESSGDSMAHRNKKVEPLEGFTRIENNGDAEPEIIRLDFGRRYLSD